jgi:disulfide bond formation protein DsbB
VTVAAPMSAVRSRRAPPLLLALGAGAALVVGGAWIFQAFGYAPCELCLKERIPYYVGTVVALVAAGAAWRGGRAVGRAALWGLAVLFAASAVFGAYHAGVEWGWWAGPSDCTGTPARAASMDAFMQQLQAVKVVRCDAVAIRILGLSLAGWNAVASLALALAGAIGARTTA